MDKMPIPSSLSIGQLRRNAKRRLRTFSFFETLYYILMGILLALSFDTLADFIRVYNSFTTNGVTVGIPDHYAWIFAFILKFIFGNIAAAVLSLVTIVCFGYPLLTTLLFRPSWKLNRRIVALTRAIGITARRPNLWTGRDSLDLLVERLIDRSLRHRRMAALSIVLLLSTMGAAIYVVVFLEFHKDDLETRAAIWAEDVGRLADNLKLLKDCQVAQAASAPLLEQLRNLQNREELYLTREQLMSLDPCSWIWSELGKGTYSDLAYATNGLAQAQGMLTRIVDSKNQSFVPVVAALLGRLSIVGLAFSGIYIFGSLYRYNMSIASRYTAMADAVIICRHENKGSLTSKGVDDLMTSISGAQDDMFKGKQLMEHFTEIFGKVIDRLAPSSGRLG
jgi:hypothetical protein